MALVPGVRLTHFEVGSLLGAGGMGRVYQARDTTLARDVALKVIPDGFSRDPERLARFEREAKLLASLNHPNIAAIHSFEREGDVHFLVMELVPGKTLAEILTSGPLSLEDALTYLRQVAEALEAAHEKGVIHRDLKPANLKVTPEGKIKVLDFGLAKAFEEESAPPEDLSQSPTREGTRAGIILGTAPYMSPEQARGKRVDKLTDVWSFGCVLYEALTGRAAFHGETVTDTLAAVVRAEPDWSALPEGTPAAIRTLLERCLRKDPKRRLHDMADARIEIEEMGVAPWSASVERRARWKAVVPWVIAGVALAMALLGLFLRKNEGDRVVARLEMPFPADFEINHVAGPGVALSPDGKLVAYISQQGPSLQVYVRPIDKYESKPIPSVSVPSGVSFSPDGRFLTVFSRVAVTKVSLSDGLVTSLAQSASIRGASWGSDDRIVYASLDGLWRVPAAGGPSEKLTNADTAQGESFRWPVLLPGGRAILFTRTTLEPGVESRIEALFVDTGARRTVVEKATSPIYVPTGHLLFARDKTLLAAPFDANRCETTGLAAPVIDQVSVGVFGDAKVAVSRNGSLVYAPRVAGEQLVRVDRHGGEESLTPVREVYQYPRVSPDGTRLVVEVDGAIWLVDLDRNTMTRFALGPGPTQSNAVWTPDGKRVLFTSGGQVLSKPADGSSGEESIRPEEASWIPRSVSPDGQILAASELSSSTALDIVLISLEGERTRRPFLETPAFEGGAQFSPDGRFLAYASDESGRMEVYLQPYPGPGGRIQISTEGGNQACWSRDGKEIFYRNGAKMMAVQVSSAEKFTASKPEVLFEREYAYGAGSTFANYDVTPDGHFVMVKTEPPKLNVVLNWFEELKQKVPAR